MRFVMAFLAAGLALAASSCSPSQDQAKGLTKVTLGYTAVAETVGAYAALKEGYFAQNGLDVKFLLVNNSATLANSLVAQSIDVASITPSVVLQAVDNGIDIVVISGVAVASATRKSTAAIVREGVDIKTAQDFVGKKVALSGLRSALHIEFVNWLKQQGIDPKSVRFVEAPFPTHADLLKSGAVDAALSIEPFIQRATDAKVAHVVTSMSDKVPPDTSLVSLAARREWADKNPAAVAALRDAVRKGTEFVEANRDKAHLYVGEMLKLPPDAATQTEFGELKAEIVPAQFQWWIDVMTDQQLVRNKLDASKIVIK